MTINIGHLYKKRTVRNLSGGIIDMVDETNGGVLISKGRVVNQERIDELAKIEEDKRKSATAFVEQIDAPEEVREERTVTPPPSNKMQELEKKVEGMESKLDAILKALNK